MRKIIIFKRVDDLQKYTAKKFIDTVLNNPKATIGFATGVSPVPAYKIVYEDHQKNGTSWKNVTTFNLDEFVGIDKNDPQSFVRQMKDNLFNHIDVSEENVNIPDASTKNPTAESKKYETIIQKKGPIDFQYISLGVNGHIAYNEPGTPLDTLTHVASLTKETIEDMVTKGKFKSYDEAPKHAITMGVKTLLDSTKEILMVSFGAQKAEVTRAMLEDTPNTEVTATALQSHGNITYILDESAASKLSKETLDKSVWR